MEKDVGVIVGEGGDQLRCKVDGELWEQRLLVYIRQFHHRLGGGRGIETLELSDGLVPAALGEE